MILPPVGIVTVHDAAKDAYAQLKSSAAEDAELAHGPIELLREILNAVHVLPEYPDMKKTLEVLKLTLLLLKGFLLQWNCTEFPDKMQELPLKMLPKVSPNRCWRIEHPQVATLALEVKSSLRFLAGHALSFACEPWIWLQECLDAMDIALML